VQWYPGAASLFAACGAFACGEDEFAFPDVEPDIFGEHVEIATDYGIRVCGGDLHTLDAQVAFVREAIHSPDSDPVLYYWTYPEEVPEYCWMGLGCGYPEGGVGSSLAIGLHEVAHVAAAFLGRSRPLWEEGLADGFMPGVVERGEHHPAVMVELGPMDLAYGQAAHFFRWLWLRNPDQLLEIYRATDYDDSPAQARRIFEEVTGESLIALGDRYLDEAPRELESPHPADTTPLPWTGNVWQHTVAIDCRNDDSFADGERTVRTVYVDIAEPGEYDISSTAPANGVGRVGDPEVHRFGPPWSVARLELAAGVHWISVSSAVWPLDVRVGVYPAGGIEPTVPGG
jgi:hypothetical protein